MDAAVPRGPGGLLNGVSLTIVATAGTLVDGNAGARCSQFGQRDVQPLKERANEIAGPGVRRPATVCGPPHCRAASLSADLGFARRRAFCQATFVWASVVGGTLSARIGELALLCLRNLLFHLAPAFSEPLFLLCLLLEGRLLLVCLVPLALPFGLLPGVGERALFLVAQRQNHPQLFGFPVLPPFGVTPTLGKLPLLLRERGLPLLGFAPVVILFGAVARGHLARSLPFHRIIACEP